jgi:hypothetical protein
VAEKLGNSLLAAFAVEQGIIRWEEVVKVGKVLCGNEQP